MSADATNPYDKVADAIGELLKLKRDDPLCPLGPAPTAALERIWRSGLSLGELEHMFREAARTAERSLFTDGTN